MLPLGDHRVAIDGQHAVIVVIGHQQALMGTVKPEAARLVKAQVAAGALAPKGAAMRARLDVEHDEREFEAGSDGALGETRLVGQRLVADRLVDHALLRDREERLLPLNLLLDADDLVLAVVVVVVVVVVGGGGVAKVGSESSKTRKKGWRNKY